MPVDTDQHLLTNKLHKAAKADPMLAAIIDQYGVPEPRFRPHGFETLMRIIVSQQLSTKVAAVIWSRVAELCQDDVNAERVLATEDGELRTCGLSWRKVEYSNALAEQCVTGELDFTELTTMDTEAVIAKLIKIKGFGRWSAEVYAMFALRHEDIFPAGDLALQVGLQRLFSLDAKPTEEKTRELAGRWSPHQSSVALMIWRYYGAATMDD